MKKSAEDLLRDFCHFYFEKREVESTLALLTEDIEWFGTADFEHVCGKEDARLYLEDQETNEPDSYGVIYHMLHEVPMGEGMGTAFADLDLVGADASLRCRMTVSTRVDAGESKICAMHMSVGLTLQKGREYFPLTVASEKLQQELDKALAEKNHLINAISGGTIIFKVSERTTLEFISDGVLRLGGYAQEEWSDHRNMLNLFSSQDHPKLEHLLAEAELSPLNCNVRLRHRDGSDVWVHLSGIPIGEEDGCPLYYAVLIASSEETMLYSALLDDSSDAVYVTSMKDYRLLYMNRATQQVSEGKGLYVGQPCYKYIMGLDAPCFNCARDEMRRDSLHCREITDMRSGDVCLLRGKLLDWKGEDAHVEYASNITDRARAEELLRQEKARTERQYVSLMNLYSSIPGGVAVLDVSGENVRVQYVNTTFCRLLGYEQSELSRLGNAELYSLLHPDDRAAARHYEKEKGELSVEGTFRFLKKGGGYHWLKVTGHSLHDEGKMLLPLVFTDMNAEKLALEKLSLSESRLRIAMEQTGITFWLYDIPKRHIETDMPDTLLPLSTARENVPEVIWGTGDIHPEDEHIVREMYERVFAGESPVSCTSRWRYRRRDSYQWMHIVYTILKDGAGRPVFAIGSATDVSDRVKAEQQFQDAAAFSRIVSEKSLGFLKINLTQNTLEDGSSWPEYMDFWEGMSCDELLDRLRCTILRVDGMNDWETTLSRAAMLQKFADGMRGFSFDAQMLRESGKRVWVRLRQELMPHPLSGDIMIFSCVEDITEQKLTQIMMDNVVEIEYDYLCIIDGNDGSFLCYNNSNSRTVLPPHRGDSYDQSVWERSEKIARPEDREIMMREKCLASVLKHLEQEDVYFYYCTAIQTDGSKAQKRLRFSYLDREARQIICTSSDVTHLYEVEERKNAALRDALAAAEQANKAKSIFLSSMSHDIRTPLNAIIGMTELMQEDKENLQTVTEGLDVIHSSSNHLLSLIEDILDMSKIESGRMVLVSEEFSLKELLKSISRMTESMFRRKKQIFIMDVQVEHDHVAGDQARLSRVLVNLLSNASKFSPEGGEISFRIQEKESGKPTIALVSFVVSDHGMGISPEMLPKVFDPFVRDGIAAISHVEGTGLGLAIVKGIVEAKGGSVSVESTLGEGSVFTVLIPMRICETRAAEQRPQEGSQNLNFDFTGLHVLLVEDHQVNILVMQRFLEKHNAVVDVAQDGAQGCDMFMKSPAGTYQIVLMDIQMPVMNGYEAAERIRASQHPDAKTVPIVAMTANVFVEDVANAKRVGMNAHLGKPVRHADLVNTITSLCGKNVCKEK